MPFSDYKPNENVCQVVFKHFSISFSQDTLKNVHSLCLCISALDLLLSSRNTVEHQDR